jgi:hypothetical protein
MNYRTPDGALVDREEYAVYLERCADRWEAYERLGRDRERDKASDLEWAGELRKKAARIRAGH